MRSEKTEKKKHFSAEKHFYSHDYAMYTTLLFITTLSTRSECQTKILNLAWISCFYIYIIITNLPQKWSLFLRTTIFRFRFKYLYLSLFLVYILETGGWHAISLAENNEKQKKQKSRYLLSEFKSSGKQKRFLQEPGIFGIFNLIGQKIFLVISNFFCPYFDRCSITKAMSGFMLILVN